ncbi:MAG: hypothetical protein LBV08_03670 [Clostridiales bacterium]|jgi:cell division protein FtsI/penicillin-binding protein 2|nr:hypothetical protein [Clostridiales bacterium]
MFYIITARLFDMQIVNSQQYSNSIKTTSTKEVVVKAPRGNIVDKYGRPLAVNKSIRVVKIEYSMFSTTGAPIIARDLTEGSEAQEGVLVDSESEAGNLHSILYQLVKLLEANGEAYKDDFPISKTEPFEYLYDGNQKRELAFIEGLGLGKEYIPAGEVIKKLRENDVYGIPEGWTDIEARKVLAFLVFYRQNMYTLYTPVTIAENVSDKTAVTIAENHTFYHGISVVTESVRDYPYGIYASNLIGFTRKISEEEFEERKGLGYTRDDMIGKSGLEASFEDYLRGKDGQNTIEVNRLNKKVGTVEQVDPQQGNTIVTNIDIELQKQVYEIMQQELKTVILNKIRRVSSLDPYISDSGIIQSIAKGNAVSIKKIMESGEGSYSFKARELILNKAPEIDVTESGGVEEAKNIIIESLEASELRNFDFVMIMREQSIITGDEEYFGRYADGFISTMAVLTDKIENNELTPQMLGLDPFSASVVMVNVNTGAVILAVGYPSYDNNLISNIEYFNNINTDSVTTPMYNRPFQENLAPGSVFKMISAITGLETGAINESSTYYDYVTFTEAGIPYSSCWSSTSHGSVNVLDALEVSCNYFFFETAYKMIGSENPYQSITNLNKYMTSFGLNDKTGVEIFESAITQEPGVPRISSPELKKHRKPDEPWTEGDTIRTAIGQSENSYTPAVMAKYISTIATKGIRYSLQLVDKAISPGGVIINQKEPIVEEVLDINPSTWELIFTGMRNVITGSRGTARTIFNGFNVEVAGKTGTAEQDKRRSDHSSFGGFAPFDNPEVAIYVSVPFGDSKGTPAVASSIARKVFDLYFNSSSGPEQLAPINTLVR